MGLKSRRCKVELHDWIHLNNDNLSIKSFLIDYKAQSAKCPTFCANLWGAWRPAMPLVASFSWETHIVNRFWCWATCSQASHVPQDSVLTEPAQSPDVQTALASFFHRTCWRRAMCTHYAAACPHTSIEKLDDSVTRKKSRRE